MKFFLLIGIAAASILSGCAQSIMVENGSPHVAQDYFWQRSSLSTGITYSVTRNNTATDHSLTSSNGRDILDGSLDEVTLVVNESRDSVLIDSMGTNSIFSLPKGYSFGRDTTIKTKHITQRDTTISVLDTMRVKVGNNTYADSLYFRDTTVTVSDVTITDSTISIPGSLLALVTSGLDSGKSWSAGTLVGLGISPNGIPISATVIDYVTSLSIPPVHPGADSVFGESFRIRYAPVVSDYSNVPIYWIAYYAKGVGPIRIEEYTVANNRVSEAQIVK